MTPYTHNLKLCRITAFSLGLLIAAVTAGGAFGVVWLRQGVAQHANATQEIQTRIDQAERRSMALKSRVAKAESLQYLSTRVPADMRRTQQSQIVWMPRVQPLTPADYVDPTLAAPVAPAQPVEDSPTPAPTAVAAAPEESTPQIISFDLALSTVNEPVSRARNQ